jgi:hypothetical protein
LTSPLSTYNAHAGDPVHAILTEGVKQDGDVVLPVGTEIDGVVRSVRKVGWGIRHETAALRLEFIQAVTPQGASISISARVAEVENAREAVKHGVIEGVCSSFTPQGRITSRLKYLPTLNPYPDIGLIAFKATFPIFPEPEIYLPAGADLRLDMTADLSTLPPVPDATLIDSVEGVPRAQLEQLARSVPQYTTTSGGVDADLINLAFFGSRDQIELAFRQAGWSTSDPHSKRAVMHNFYAFLNDSGYARAPMRPLLLDGSPPDMNFQKSLNSYAKRDHLRIWRWSPKDSEQVWLSSSTHDTGATLSVKHHRFVHHIGPYIDEERSKVIRDLSLAGCVKWASMVPRASVPGFSRNAIGDLVRTDAALAVVQLQDCEPTIPGVVTNSPNPQFKAGNKAFRYIRREILTLRSDLWRANIIYGAYELGSMAFEVFRHHPQIPPVANENTFAVKSSQTITVPASGREPGKVQ